MLKTLVENFKGKSKFVLSDLFFLDKQKYSSSNFHDYLGWCEALGMDITNKRIRYPDDI